jgi:integrase
MTAPKGPKPKKPKNCPLFPHAGGTWCATIAGKHKHFGPWGDLEGALKRHENFMAAYRAGQKAKDLPDGMLPLSLLANKYLTYQHGRAKAAEITLRSFRDIKDTVEVFVESVGGYSLVSSLAPENFAAYRAKLMKTMGHHAIKRSVTLIRGMFKWAYDNDVIASSMKFGTGFSAYKKERVESRKRQRDLSFTGPEIRLMVESATIPLKAMILMGINCGFGNNDIGTLTWDSLDLDGAVLDTFRQKTGVMRRCPLWPETVKALGEVAALKRRPLMDADKGKVFINQNGVPYVREEAVEKNGVIEGVSVNDNIPQEFSRLMADIGIYGWSKPKSKGKRPRPVSDGRGFYCLRRTHRTWADDAKDANAADTIMGHAFETMGGTYVQGVPDARLKAITDHIHSKVFT